MLSSITWGQYISAMAILLCCYYAYVGYNYFKWELLALIGIKKVEDSHVSVEVAEIKRQFISENDADYLPKEIVDGGITPVINAFKDEVNAFLVVADADPDSLLDGLKAICKKYPIVKNANDTEAINAFLLSTITNHKPGIIHEQDIQQLWC